MKKKPHLKDDPLAEFRAIWRRVMAQVGAHKDASQLINDELTPALRDMTNALHEATELVQIAARANSMMNPQKPSLAALEEQGVLAPPRSRKLSQSERSAIIKQVAKQIMGSPPEVHVREVAKAIADQGIDLGTSVPGTAIGNVLNKSPDWKRVTKGVFAYVGS